MRRFKHGLSHYRLFTCDMGELIPCACYEVLPGDTIQQATSLLVRVSPLLAPVMHPVQVRVHHWFVPNRLLWDKWEKWITGDDTSQPPRFVGYSIDKGSIGDYMGLPTDIQGNFSQLPFSAYNKIYNEFYRDQDLCPEVATDNRNVQKISWEKDYFTAARPWPQKGPDITLPLGIAAPVRGLGLENTTVSVPPGTQFYEMQGPRVYAQGQWFNVTAGARQAVEMEGGLPKVYADLTNATAVNINDVRKAFALQRYEEARAQYGSRYTEYLRYLGVRSSDARLQRPEYLGGGKATISFSEVLQTGPGVDPDVSVVGSLKGHGISALRSRRYRRFFEEHGFVITLFSVRPKTMYLQGMSKMWLRNAKEDYWQKELELIGQQQVLNGELYASGPAPLDTFGYQDRYDEYRHHESGVSGDFRDTLNFWHMAREFAAAPVLNKSFVECDPTKRVNAVQTEDVLWVMANHSIQARRMLTKKTIGRVI